MFILPLVIAMMAPTTVEETTTAAQDPVVVFTNEETSVVSDPLARGNDEGEGKEAIESAENGALQATDPVLSSQIEEKIAEEIAQNASNIVEKLKVEAEARGIETARLEAERRIKELEDQKIEESLARRRIGTKVFKLAHANAEELAKRFNETWNGEFGSGWKLTKIAQPFPEANAIMVTAPRMVLDTCEKVIEQVDVQPKQVYIEARFVELSNNASHKLGIDWQMLDGMRGSLALDAGYKAQNLEGVSTFNSSDGSFTVGDTARRQNANLSHINGTLGMSELYVILRALESNEDARTFSNPKIIVTSGKRAVVDMTTKYPNVTIAAKKQFNTSGTSTDLDMKMASIPGEDKFMFANEAFFSWGISLEVTPRIGTNDLINVQIVPTISDCTDFVTAGTSNNNKKNDDDVGYSAKYPVINVQRLVTEFNMASGTTAVIGGLSRTVETQQDNGIPWLRDIWWIGPRLFGSRVRVKEQKEIIVFVTVGLVDPNNIRKDAGLPKNAVLGRLYTDEVRLEPGDRDTKSIEGMGSLDLRSLEEQYANPQNTNTVDKAGWFESSRQPAVEKNEEGKEVE